MKVFIVLNDVGKVLGATIYKDKLQKFLKEKGWYWDDPNSDAWTFHFAGGRPCGSVVVFEMDAL